MDCSICIWSHDIKVLFLSPDPVKDILDMLALDLGSSNPTGVPVLKLRKQ